MSDNKAKRLVLLNLGRIGYRKAWDIQKKLVSRRVEDIPDDILLTCEHDPVITMGRGTDKNNLLVTETVLSEKGVELYDIERGGDITFHGPGQTILYPIIDLRNRNKDAHKYLRDLETVVILALDKLGLGAAIKKGLTGIWVDDAKVGAIGVAVSKWITYHGLALNVNTDLDYFKLINPCGITEYPVGSISALLKKKISLDEINQLLIDSMVQHFGYENIVTETIDQLI